MALKVIVQHLRRHDIECHFAVECTDFKKKHPVDFRYVSDMLGVEPVVLCAGQISACYRKRAAEPGYADGRGGEKILSQEFEVRRHQRSSSRDGARRRATRAWWLAIEAKPHPLRWYDGV